MTKKSLCLSLIILVNLLIGCVGSYSLIDANESSYSLGARKLPEDFLDWWFSQIKSTENFSSQLIMKETDIMKQQFKITTPVISIEDIPTYYFSNYTSVKNQNSNGTCWAFATVGSLESALITQLGTSGIENRYPFIDVSNPLTSVDLSEQYVAYYNADLELRKEADKYHIELQETNRDQGGYAFYSTYNLFRRGVPLESDIPYINEDYNWIKFNTSNDVWKNHLVKSSGTIVIQNSNSFDNYETYINTIKSALIKYANLVVESIIVYKGFEEYSDGLYFAYGEKVGAHAVLLTGWIDEYYDEKTGYYGPAWILKNSWGTEWGKEGFWLQPFTNKTEFSNSNIPDWKIESSNMYVPILK